MLHHHCRNFIIILIQYGWMVHSQVPSTIYTPAPSQHMPKGITAIEPTRETGFDRGDITMHFTYLN